jgi:serine/threonine protein kinase
VTKCGQTVQFAARPYILPARDAGDDDQPLPDHGKTGHRWNGCRLRGRGLRLRRKVALKFLPEELAGDPDSVRRFRREAETIATLNHGHICAIYDIDEHEGRAFIVMECVEGTNLKTHMSRRTLTTNQIVDLTLQIAGALEAAHGKGIVHRDIKPGNIVVNEAGEVKVLDFGLARRFRSSDYRRTRPGRIDDPGDDPWARQTTWQPNAFCRCRWIRAAISSRSAS